MRRVFRNILNSDNGRTLAIVSSYRDKYKRLDARLLTMPEILQVAYEDIVVLSKSKDSVCEDDFTADNILRAILVMQIEGFSFQETTIRIAESVTLQTFCRLDGKKTIDHTLLCRAFHAIQDSTWKKLKHFLGIKIPPSAIKVRS
jgi:hypothetical protein